jgi:hypothetical protein
MSDFFSNLVARTIAQPTLRPRTRSRFEAPALDETPPVWPEATRTARTDEEPRTATAAPASPSTPQLPAERARPVGMRRSVTPAPDARDVQKNAQKIEESAGRERSELSEPGRPPDEATRAVAQDQKRVVIERDVQRVVDSSERVVPVAVQVPVAVPVRVPVPVAARPHRYDEQPPRIIERRGPREIEEVQRERVIRTTLERTQRVIGKAQQAESATPSEPTIQVSIGRIEVRAVTSAPQPRNASRGNGTMSIDDYVAKRKAKDRR